MSELARPLALVEKLRDLSDRIGAGEESEWIAEAADYLESLYVHDRSAWPRKTNSIAQLDELKGCFPWEIALMLDEACKMIFLRGAYLSIAERGAIRR